MNTQLKGDKNDHHGYYITASNPGMILQVREMAGVSDQKEHTNNRLNSRERLNLKSAANPNDEEEEISSTLTWRSNFKDRSKRHQGSVPW